MNSDYEIRFKFTHKQESAKLDKLLDQFIATVERANSYTGGGCDPRGGEFFIETGDGFRAKDLLALLAVWLPYAKNMSLKAVAKEMQPSGNGGTNHAPKKAKVKE